MNKITLFTKGHPLKMEARLKLKGYNPIFSFNLTPAISTKTVLILVSLVELVPSINFLQTEGVEIIKIAVFGSEKVLDYAPANLNFDIHKRPNFDIIPNDIKITSINLPQIANLDPLAELNQHISYSKLIRNITKGKVNARRTKSSSK